MTSSKPKKLVPSPYSTTWSYISLAQNKNIADEGKYIYSEYAFQRRVYNLHLIQILARYIFDNNILLTKFGSGFWSSSTSMNFPGYDWENSCLKPNCKYPTLTYQSIDLLDDLSLIQLVTIPTRGNNTLDLVITNNPSIVTACRVIPGVSDHDTVLTEINIKPLRNRQTPRKIPLYTKANWEGLKNHILEFGKSLHQTFDISTPINQLWENTTSELERAISKFIPHKTAKNKDKQPCINSRIRRLMRKRDKLYFKNRHQPSPEKNPQTKIS